MANNFKNTPPGYGEVYVWPGASLGPASIEDYEQYMLEEFGVRVQYLGEISGDLYFAVHLDDVAHFAIPRLREGILSIVEIIRSIYYH